MSAPKRWGLGLAVLLLATVLLPVNAATADPPAVQAAASAYTYDPKGEYLNYADTTPIERKSRMKLDAAGVIMVLHTDGIYYYNPVTISQYGLQQWSKWRRSGDPKQLKNAVIQANWLVKNQDQTPGIWRYSKPWAVAGFSETLPAGWASAMAQGQAMSLLTRIYSKYPDKPLYIQTARRAYRPFVKTVANGGLVATYKNGPYYEEYPTRTAPSLTLNGFQFSLIGLYDLWKIGFQTGGDLFVKGYATMVKSLPDYDSPPGTTYHLGHLTKPPRAKVINNSYHAIHVRLLYTLDTVAPNRTAKSWADRWSTYPAMNPTTSLQQGFGPGVPSGDGDLAIQ